MRLRLVMAFIFVVFVLLLSRVYYLAIKSNVYYEEMARAKAPFFAVEICRTAVFSVLETDFWLFARFFR